MKSNDFLWSIRSINDVAISVILGSKVSIVSGVKDFETALRSLVCSSGSVPIMLIPILDSCASDLPSDGSSPAEFLLS